MEMIVFGTGMLVLAAGVCLYGRQKERRLLERLESMLEKARSGSFRQEEIDETMVSSVENSMARFLEDSRLAEENMNQRKERVQTMISDISHQTAIPISNILVYSQLLEEDCADPQMREYGTVIRQQGEKSAIAAILGSKNMFLAIVASTLTTLCVFVPFIIYKYDLGMMGIMFQDLVITVCISLACSLFVSVTLVPALCGSILRINTRTQKPLRFKPLKVVDDALAKAEEKMRNAYAHTLDYFLSHRLLLVVFLILLLAFSFAQFPGTQSHKKGAVAPQMTAHLLCNSSSRSFYVPDN